MPRTYIGTDRTKHIWLGTDKIKHVWVGTELVFSSATTVYTSEANAAQYHVGGAIASNTSSNTGWTYISNDKNNPTELDGEVWDIRVLSTCSITFGNLPDEGEDICVVGGGASGMGVSRYRNSAQGTTNGYGGAGGQGGATNTQKGVSLANNTAYSISVGAGGKAGGTRTSNAGSTSSFTISSSNIIRASGGNSNSVSDANGKITGMSDSVTYGTKGGAGGQGGAVTITSDGQYVSTGYAPGKGGAGNYPFGESTYGYHGAGGGGGSGCTTASGSGYEAGYNSAGTASDSKYNNKGTFSSSYSYGAPSNYDSNSSYGRGGRSGPSRTDGTAHICFGGGGPGTGGNNGSSSAFTGQAGIKGVVYIRSHNRTV